MQQTKEQTKPFQQKRGNKKQKCSECGNYDILLPDSLNKKWYCESCWVEWEDKEAQNPSDKGEEEAEYYEGEYDYEEHGEKEYEDAKDYDDEYDENVEYAHEEDEESDEDEGWEDQEELDEESFDEEEEQRYSKKEVKDEKKDKKQNGDLQTQCYQCGTTKNLEIDSDHKKKNQIYCTACWNKYELHQYRRYQKILYYFPPFNPYYHFVYNNHIFCCSNCLLDETLSENIDVQRYKNQFCVIYYQDRFFRRSTKRRPGIVHIYCRQCNQHLGSMRKWNRKRVMALRFGSIIQMPIKTYTMLSKKGLPQSWEKCNDTAVSPTKKTKRMKGKAKYNKKKPAQQQKQHQNGQQK